MTVRRMPVVVPQHGQLPPRRGESSDDMQLTVDGIPEKLVKPWKLPAQQVYIFRHANVVDPVSGTVKTKQTVKLSNGLIESVEPTHSHDASTTESSADAVVLELNGKYLCPGLIDCHVHLSAVAGDASLSGGMGGQDIADSYFRQPYLCGQMLSRGFTTVRDTGGATLSLKEALADDVFPGPRLFIVNKALSQTGGHGDTRGSHDHQQCCTSGALSMVCDGVPACTLAAREQFRTGADFIKVMTGGGVASPTDKLENTQFTAAELRAITEVADTYGSFVTAHAYTPKAIRHAVDNGVMGIEHGNLVDEDTARYMASKGVWLTPTLVTYDAMGSSKYAGFLPPANAAKNREVLARGLESLRIAHEAGVTICHGSDLLGPLQAEQSREFEIRSRALSSATVLRGATVNAAKMLGQEGFLGQVKQGFAADVLVLQENPLEDVAVLGRPEESVLAVVKNGRVYSSRWNRLPQDSNIGQPLNQ
jgi:imidazolonepropionase-like amidohydrolase